MMKVKPLFGSQLQGEPHIFDFSSKNPKTSEYDTYDFNQFQSLVFKELEEVDCQWGIGKYLEERENLLRKYPQMIREGRVHHLGLDIIVPAGFSLHAPLGASVYQTGKEDGVGNYGGYVILCHRINGNKFYSFYGHLNSNHIVSKGQKLSAGDEFALTGEGEDSGHWFTHTHLQIITKKAAQENRFFQGYIAKENLHDVDEFFPTPYPLFKY